MFLSYFVFHGLCDMSFKCILNQQVKCAKQLYWLIRMCVWLAFNKKKKKKNSHIWKPENAVKRKFKLTSVCLLQSYIVTCNFDSGQYSKCICTLLNHRTEQ